MTRFLPAACLLLAACSDPIATPDPSEDATTMADDQHLWLEEVDGERALAFVEQQNQDSAAALEGLATYGPYKDQALAILDSDQRIPHVGFRGTGLYNFWQDADHERGILRRTTAASYRQAEPDWELVLDVDALAAAEAEDWVYKGSNCLEPTARHCLLALSRGGSDANVLREFDLQTKQFVAGGFTLPQSKGSASWIDRDTLLVAREAGPGTLTSSGYPATVRVWQRGTPLADAPQVLATAADSVGIFAGTLDTDGGTVPVVQEALTFYTSRLHLWRTGGPVAVDLPLDAEAELLFGGRLLVSLKSPWTVAGTSFGAGDLVALELEPWLAGQQRAELVLAAPANGAITGVSRSASRVLVTTLEDVQSRLYHLHRGADGWQQQPVDLPGIGAARLVASSPLLDRYFHLFENFLTPDTLYLTDATTGTSTAAKALPPMFDTAGMAVQQHFATSADGTRVPYFLVLPKGFLANGSTPTLIGAYGGFEVSRLPFYSALIGNLWLAEGAAYVLANIRGGGEYGPAWHQAALRENRPRAFEDLEAVAEDLVRRGITRPQHLGIMGGSNGGLLTGAALTRRPELYGAVVSQVPLLDMQRYHHLLAGASWMAEYGDPDSADWDYIKTWSPYHNIKADAAYPPTLFWTSTRDDRVHPGHARRMVAKMQASGHSNVLYYENTVGGHAGSTTNAQQAHIKALEFSFLRAALTPEQ